MPSQGVAARMERAYRNFLETFPLFAAGGVGGARSRAIATTCRSGGAGIYVIGRIVYIPLYAGGDSLCPHPGLVHQHDRFDFSLIRAF